jgi:hypothetical protein
VELHEALRTVEQHGLRVMIPGASKAKMLAAAGWVEAPAAGSYPGESEAARLYRLQYRAKLEAADREARARAPVRAAAAAPVPDPGDYAEFPVPPWTRNAELHIPRVVERPAAVWRALLPA